MGEAGAQDPFGPKGRVVQRMLDQVVCRVQRLARSVVDLRSRPFLGDQFAGEVADGDADVLMADVGANRERGTRHEREQGGRAAGVAGPRAIIRGIVLANEMGPAEFFGNRRHGASGEVGLAGDVGPAAASIAVDRLDHPQPVPHPVSLRDATSAARLLGLSWGRTLV